MVVSVAIPVRNGGALLRDVLAAVRSQHLPAGVELELVVCDSASSDGSAALARGAGASVFTIAPSEFSHGGTRNLLMERSAGEFVAFLTQDAVPAGPGWLAALLAGFDAGEDVGLVFGPYVARRGASLPVALELQRWFGSLSVGAGDLRVDRLAPERRDVPAAELYGPPAYFTDANGCIRRRAWEQVPFPEVAYAEDHALAIAMLRAGWAKVYAPAAAVIHSHEYSLAGWLRRSFDETRAVQALYGVGDVGSWPRLARGFRGSVGADRRAGARGTALLGSFAHHGARALGTAAGARAGRLPRRLVRALSLERRA